MVTTTLNRCFAFFATSLLLSAGSGALLADACPPSDHDCATIGVPGCTNVACCKAVCALDPFCCAVAWDGACVALAGAICTIEACDVDLDPLATAEPDDTPFPVVWDDPTIPGPGDPELPETLHALFSILEAESEDPGLSLHRRFRFELEDGTTGWGYHPFPHDESLGCLDINSEEVETAVILDFKKPFVTYTTSTLAGGGDVATATWFRRTGAEPPLTPIAVPADINRDGKVDGEDLGRLLMDWGACLGCGDAPICPADLNGDGVVDGADLGELLSHWGTYVVDDETDPSELLGTISAATWTVSRGGDGTLIVDHASMPDLLDPTVLANGGACFIDWDVDGLAEPLKCTICKAVLSYIIKKGSWKAKILLCPTTGIGAPICVAAVSVVEWGLKKWGASWVCKKVNLCP